MYKKNNMIPVINIPFESKLSSSLLTIKGVNKVFLLICKDIKDPK